MLTIEVLKLLCSRPRWWRLAGFSLMISIHDCRYSLADRLSAKLMLVTSTVNLGIESHGSHDHILLSDSSGSLQTLSTHCLVKLYSLYNLAMDSIGNPFPAAPVLFRVYLQQFLYCCMSILCCGKMFWLPLPSNGCLLWLL
jgi:hypothetical protein